MGPCLAGVLAFLGGCQGDADSADGHGGLAGGWSNEDAHQFACVADDGSLWLGDSLTEIGGPSRCSVDEAGATFSCTDADDGSSFGGSITAVADELTISVTPCPGDPDECQATYARDPSVTCDD